jgi:hypothetical protein
MDDALGRAAGEALAAALDATTIDAIVMASAARRGGVVAAQPPASGSSRSSCTIASNSARSWLR